MNNNVTVKGEKKEKNKRAQRALERSPESEDI